MNARTRRNVTLTRAQLDAVSFACHSTLAEPANFEDPEQAKLYAPMQRAFAKVQRALEQLESGQ